MASTWQGVMPAMMTEFAPDGALNLDSTAAHVARCAAAGATGFVMLGTLGENASLSAEEKVAVLRAAREAAGGRPVLSGVAEYTTELAAETARRAEAAGADGLMALPAMVYHQDQREGLAHFRSLARATDLPVMIYNNPVAYQLDLSLESFAELAEEPTIVAVKESSHDSRRITDMINRLGDRVDILCGVDDLVLENVLFGAVGWVAGLANPFPVEAVRLYELAAAGRVDEARALYRWFMPLLHLDTAAKLVQYIKLADALTGEGAEMVRPPRLPLIGAERAGIEASVRQALATRSAPDAAA